MSPSVEMVGLGQIGQIGQFGLIRMSWDVRLGRTWPQKICMTQKSFGPKIYWAQKSKKIVTKHFGSPKIQKN